MLDTNVISKLRKPKPRGAVLAAQITRWVDQLAGSLAVLPMDGADLTICRRTP